MKKFLVLLLVLAVTGGAWAAQHPSALQVGTDIVSISAGDLREGSIPGAFDGTGLDAGGELHTANYTDKWMGSIDGLSGAVPAHPGTASGMNWLKVEFDVAKTIDHMWVWNKNDNWQGLSWYYNQRGIKEVVIEYSTDNSTWERLGGAGATYTFDMAPVDTPAWPDGGPAMPHTSEIDFGGIQAQQIVITVQSIWGDPIEDFEFAGVSEISFNQVPEPVTMVLLGVGGLALIRRRR